MKEEDIMAEKSQETLRQEMIEREAIRTLAVRYGHCVWQKDVDGYVNLFTEDGSFSTDDPNLPAQAEALRQGPHRYARAQFVYDFARREAERLGLPFHWKLIRVEGVGHDGAAMSRAAAAYWFEGRIPPAEELVTAEAGAL